MRHLYIHIPFCDSKCPYCSFNSFAGSNTDKKHSYINALLKQLEFELVRFKAEKGSLLSVYFGGGTPSTIKADAYAPIFDRLRPYFSEQCEITFEANPNSATKEWLKGVKNLGANRLSLGIQSFDAAKLKLLGRIHSSTDAKMAVQRAKQIGFDNISIDLIYDTAFDNEEFLLQEAKEAVALDISHISAYSLTIEDESSFAGKNELKVENIQAALSLVDYLANNGFKHYEVSNFGKKKSMHNTAYWQGADYAGVGCGAVGFLGNMRYYPPKELLEYMSNPLACEAEILSEDDLAFERLFLGLRSDVGIKTDSLSKEQIQKVQILTEEGKLDVKGDSLTCTDFFLADEIVLFLS